MKSLHFLLYLILPVIIGCFTGDKTSQNVLKVALLDNPTNLDPRTYNDVASYRIIEQIYDPLLKLDSSGIPQPVLAERCWTKSDTVYFFDIKTNVFFHDSVKLSAYDVAYTYESILDPSLKSPARNSFQVIDKITVCDSFNLKIKLKYPFSPFLSNLDMGIIPKHIVKEQKDFLRKKPLGSGPYSFVKWEPDLYINLKANPYYWEGKPLIDGLEIKILPESTTRILALEYGDVDFMMNDFPLSYLKHFKNNSKLKVRMAPGSNYVYIGFNLRNTYLKHVKIRQALAYAIDVDKIINTIMEGIYQKANSLLNPLHWAYNPNLKDYSYDVEKAKKLLDEAGFPDPDGNGPESRFSLNYKSTDKQLSRQKAQIIQQYLEKVGIKINIQTYEWGTFFDDIQNGRFDMYSLTWVGLYEPDHYDRIFHSKSIQNGSNRGGYHNNKVDLLIEEAQKTLDINKRRDKYYQIQEIINEELPYISLWYETNVAVMNKKVFGFKFYPAAEWRSFKKVYFQ